MTESQDPAVTRSLLSRLEAENEKALQAARAEILAWQKQFAEVNEVKDRLQAENERLRAEIKKLQAVADQWMVFGLGPSDYEAGR